MISLNIEHLDTDGVMNSAKTYALLFIVVAAGLLAQITFFGATDDDNHSAKEEANSSSATVEAPQISLLDVTSAQPLSLVGVTENVAGATSNDGRIQGSSPNKAEEKKKTAVPNAKRALPRVSDKVALQLQAQTQHFLQKSAPRKNSPKDFGKNTRHGKKIGHEKAKAAKNKSNNGKKNTHRR